MEHKPHRTHRRRWLAALVVAPALVFFAAQAAHADALDAIAKRGTLRVAVPEDYPPFGSVGPDMKPQGYDIDMATLRISDERDRPFRDRDRGFRQRDRPFRERDRADRKAGLALCMTSITRAMLAGFGRREHARAPDEHAHDQGRFTT